jgi:predicted metalloendopeptidase
VKKEKICALRHAKMLQYLGENPEQAKANADKILALENTNVKTKVVDRVERRDSKKHNPTAIADLKKWYQPSIGMVMWKTVGGCGVLTLSLFLNRDTWQHCKQFCRKQSRRLESLHALDVVAWCFGSIVNNYRNAN